MSTRVGKWLTFVTMLALRVWFLCRSEIRKTEALCWMSMLQVFSAINFRPGIFLLFMASPADGYE